MAKEYCFQFLMGKVNPFVNSPVSCIVPLFSSFLALFFIYFTGGKVISGQSLCLSLTAAVVGFFLAKRFHLFPRRRRVVWHIGNDEPLKNPVSRYAKEGVECYENGDTYHGEFHLGKYNGSGVSCLSENGRYEGDWVNGLFDGYGIKWYGNGNRYIGKFYKGNPYGYGVFQYSNGDRYSGEWINGQSYGKGVQSFKGNHYRGEFRRGIMHGFGVCYFRNGNVYSGEYYDGCMSGFGAYNFANGDRYEGSMSDDVANGYGAFTLAKGGVKTGEWRSSALNTPIPPTDPKVHEFIESAKSAAEKANRLSNVEGDVDKAAAIANIAAHDARVAAKKAAHRHNRRINFWPLIHSFRSFLNACKIKGCSAVLSQFAE